MRICWKNFTGCERRVIPKFRSAAWSEPQRKRGGQYSFSEVLIEVKHSFCERPIEWSTHSVTLETAWVGRKQSKFIWTVRRSLWYSCGLITPVQLCYIWDFQTTVSRLISPYDLWTREQKVFISYWKIYIRAWTAQIIQNKPARLSEKKEGENRSFDIKSKFYTL